MHGEKGGHENKWNYINEISVVVRAHVFMVFNSNVYTDNLYVHIRIYICVIIIRNFIRRNEIKLSA